MHSLRRLVLDFNARPKTHLALALVVAANQLTFVALAATPVRASTGSNNVSCATAVDGASTCAAPTGDTTQLALPRGTSLCPRSGPAAACSGSDAAVAATPGLSSLPPGQAACPNDAAVPVPSTPAACTDTVLAAGSSVAPSTAAGAGESAAVLPSVPVASLTTAGATQHLSLDVDVTTLQARRNALLTATASGKVSSGSAIEIFDETAGVLAGACTDASQCLVEYAATGGVHTFVAYITSPTAQLPAENGAVASNSVSVAWLDSTISVSSTVIGPGHGVTFTATSTVDVGKTGRWLEIYDLTTKTRLTYCSRGTTCTSVVTESTGGTHEIVAYLTGQPEAVSSPIYVTWLTISLTASTTTQNTDGTVYLRVTTNADITTTPWVMAIYDDRGRLVDHACKTGRSCSVQAWVSGETPWYSAEIGALPPAAKPSPLTRLLQNITPPGLVDVQVSASAIQPSRLLWGVDSCKAFTQDWWGTSGLLPQVVSAYGAPDFWGRYLTNTVCPGISVDEIATAARNHMGILPIYNDYDCSAVSSYSTGHGYAESAVNAAIGLGIPRGTVLAIDIEPPGAACPGAANVDSGFIEGWYDGTTESGYIPAYYGNGTSGSEFGTAWCTTVSLLPNVGRDSFLWSFEPSLGGSYARSRAPEFAPYNPGCPGLEAAWQYELSAGSTPDVDSDEAISQLPLWYPN